MEIIDLEHDRPVYGKQCATCKHLHTKANKTTCDAYPEGIPDGILLGYFNHTKPFPGDRGVTYERRI